MIGWMRNRVISQPLNHPNAPATRIATIIATATAKWISGILTILSEEDDRRERAGDRHQRPDGKVDAAGGDHQRHADADDDDRGDLGQVDVERSPRREIVW